MKLDFGSLWRWGGDQPKTNAPRPNESSSTIQGGDHRKGGLLDRFRHARQEGERRKERRNPATGSVAVFWTADGKLVRARGELVDAGQNGSGIGAVIRKQPAIDAPAWILTADGQALGAVTRHTAPAGNSQYRIGANLDLESVEGHGWGGVKLRWIDDENRMRISPSSLRNASEGMIEASCVESLPVGCLAYVDGRDVGCLAIVRTCETYGERRLLKLETLTDAIKTSATRAA